MNCKQGDLAIVVNSGTGEEGKIVRCVRWVGVNGAARLGESDLWEVDPPLRWGPRFGGETRLFPFAPDSCLRPIRGDLLDEETKEPVMVGA